MTVLPSPASEAEMGKGGSREGAGRPPTRPPGKKFNASIPMLAGEWAQVKAAAARTPKTMADGSIGETPAAEWARDLLLAVASGKARVVPIEPGE